MSNVNSRIFIPLYNVNLLVVQLIHNGLYTESPMAYTGTNRVYAFFSSANSNLGTHTSLTGYGFNLHNAIVNLRYLQLKETLQKVWMSTGQSNLWALGAVLYFNNNCLDTIVYYIFLSRNLLCWRHNSLSFAQIYKNISVFYSLNNAGYNLILSLRELAVNHASLSFANTLYNYLLGILGCNTAKVSRSNLYLQSIPYLIIWRNLAGHSQGNFLNSILNLINYGFNGIYMIAAGNAIQINSYILCGIKISLVGCHQGILNSIKDNLRVDTLFQAQLLECCHKSAIFIFCSLYFFCSGSHYLLTS